MDSFFTVLQVTAINLAPLISKNFKQLNEEVLDSFVQQPTSVCKKRRKKCSFASRSLDVPVLNIQIPTIFKKSNQIDLAKKLIQTY